MKEGVVVKSTGSWYQVKVEDGTQIRSRISGKFRLNGVRVTNPVAVGDRVQIILDKEEGKGTIKNILPRTNYVARQSPRKRHHVHLLASNVDQAVVIVTIVAPDLKQGFIDRFLLMTEPYDIPTYIIVNKADLFEAPEFEVFEVLQEMYESIGYTVVLTSAEEGLGIQEMRDILKDKVTLLAGQSGVGKSSLANKIQPGLELRTGEISDSSGKGQHTTTFAEMYELEFGGAIIDTPGIKTLSFNHLKPKDVAHNFREIFEYSADCKFSDCTHRNEPQCAVKAALEAEEISEYRYINYVTILEEVEEQNSWEQLEF